MSHQTQYDNFQQFSYVGADAEKFLQGQVSCHVGKVQQQFVQTAICDLKGRVHFSLWLRRQSTEHFDIVVPMNVADEFAAHIRKFGAFSKAQLTPIAPVFADFDDQNHMIFQTEITHLSERGNTWQKSAILLGEAWIDAQTQHLFQPQELRLHQRGGVDYDKGCYLGQEVVARLWFKAQPKQWLHAIQAHAQTLAPVAVGEFLADHVQVVNIVQEDNTYWALVVAKPDALQSLATTQQIDILALPEHLQGSVARQK